MPNGVTLKFRAAPHRFAQAIESVDDAAAREYLMAVFNLMWEQRIDSIDGRRGLGWFSEVVGRHIPRSFVASDVTVPWLRELRDDCLRTMPEAMFGRTSFNIVTFLEVAGLDVETPETQLFNWAKRNAPAIATLPAMKRGACLGQMLAGEECPDFELVLSPRITPDSNVCRVLFDTQSLFVRELVVDAIHSSRKQYTAARAGSVVEASRLFTGGMGFVPRRLSDFTVETFTRQHEYISENLGGHRRARALSGLVAIYLHIIELLPPDQEQFTFATGLPQQFLKRHDFSRAWGMGYRAFKHEPGDPVPQTPLWVLYPSDEELVRVNLAPSGEMVDLSCDDARLQEMLMGWAWTECGSVQAIRRAPKELRGLIDNFERMPGQAKWRVTNAGIVLWLNGLGERMGDNALNSLKVQASSLVSYGQRIGLLEPSPTALHLLQVRGEWSRGSNAEGLVEQGNMRALASELQRRSTRTLLDEAVYCAFVTIGMTNLRVGDVLSLRLGDFMDGELKGVHSVRVSTKTDGSGRRTVQIPAKVFRLLMGYVKSSEAIRAHVPPELSDYLFIYRSPRSNEFYKFGNVTFRRACRKACEDLGIPTITARDIRRLYQTEVVRQGIEMGYGRLAIGALTEHASIDTTSRHYVRESIRTSLEATYGLEIGAEPIRGSVVPDDEMPSSLGESMEDSVVEEGAGYCTRPECNILGIVPCLMCPGFLTTPRCIPEMERAMAEVNQMLCDANDNWHEREHLMEAKRIYMRYLEEMYRVKLGVAE